MSETSDDFDAATVIETLERESIVADHMALSTLKAQQAAERATTRGDAPCVDCEDPIPEPRREAVPGCLRCARCERKHVQYLRVNR